MWTVSIPFCKLGNWGTERLVCTRADGQAVGRPASGYRIWAMMRDCLRALTLKGLILNFPLFHRDYRMEYVVELHGRGEGSITTTTTSNIIITTITVNAHWVSLGSVLGMLPALMSVYPYNSPLSHRRTLRLGVGGGGGCRLAQGTHLGRSKTGIWTHACQMAKFTFLPYLQTALCLFL